MHSPDLTAGKGRGLIATEPLHPGQLLLVTPPLALVEGDLGDIPEHDELHEAIYEGVLLFSPWQAQWLKTLVCTVDSDNSSEANSGGRISSSSSSSAVNMPGMVAPAEGWWSAAAAAGSTAQPFAEIAADMSEEDLWGAIGVLTLFCVALSDDTGLSL